ncbi:glycosyltransferase family 2 protein [Candidatus Saccharibacteria bacterium]|nr:glycosyltransferase family 2 protein [Candidatus Saccharibacteria bacterium]
MKERLKSVWLVVPCFDEEEVLPESAKQMRGKLEELIRKRKVSAKSRIVLVDDGSKDRTWKIIEKFAKDKRFLGVKLSRNFGHQAALLAGLEVAKEADAVITIDADLQDDLGAVDEMIKKFKGGAEIVFGVRKSREKDTRFKRGSAGGFYKLMNLLGARTVENSADFRLMSKRAIEELEKYQEVNLFLRGIVPEIGLKTEIVEYDRKERLAGKSKYPLGKMIHFAIEGITSFSTKPIKLVFLLGAVISVLSAGVLAYALVVKFLGQTVSGWTFIIVSIWLLGGGQMLAIGIVGEYVGKIYLETKRRPRYIIEKVSRK